MEAPRLNPPNHEVAARFLSALDPTATRFSFLTHDDKGEDDDGELTRVLHLPLKSAAPALAALNIRNAGIYVLINETDFQGIRTENIKRPRAFFCDWDDSDPPPGSGALPISIVVGRQGPGSVRKRHGYWLLSEDVDIKRWGLVQRALVRKLRADPAAVLATQALRLPGMNNCKRNPVPIELDDCHPERRYTVDQVVEAYGLAPIIQQIEEELKPKPRPQRSEDDDGGPASEYTERGDWSVLERHGWTVTFQDGDEQRWAKPGGRRKDVHATTDHRGRVGIFKCFSSKAPPFEANKAYTRFQVYAMLEHSGDLSAAAKDLIASGYGRSTEERRRRYLDDLNEAQWEATLAAEPPPKVRRKFVPPPSVPPDFDDIPWDPTDDQAPGIEAAAPSAPDFDDVPWNPTDDQAPAASSGAPSNVVKGQFGNKGKKGGKSKDGKKGKGGKKIHSLPPKGKDPQDGVINFRVSKVIKWETDPPTYDFEIEGSSKLLHLTLRDLDSPAMFRRRFLATFNRRVTLPAAEDYDVLVNYWLHHLEVIEQPEESSEYGMIRSELRDLLRNLRLGDAVSDLNGGHMLEHPKSPGFYIVKRNKLRKMLSNELEGRPVAPDLMSKAMTSLGAKAERPRIQETFGDGSTAVERPEVWTFKLSLDGSDGPSESPDDPPPASADGEEPATLH